MNTHSDVYTITNNTFQHSALSTFKMSDPLEGYLWVIVPREELLETLNTIQAITGTELNERHIQDALNSEHPSFFDNTDTYEMIVFRGIASSQFDMAIPSVNLTPVSMACFQFDHLLLTVYDRQDAVVPKMIHFLERHYTRTMPNRPSDLLYKLLNMVIEQTLLLRNPLMLQISEWQKLLLEKTTTFNSWNEFMAFKSSIEQLIIWCEDQEDTVNDWEQYAQYEQPQQQFNINLNDLSDHIERCIRYAQKLSTNLDTLMQLHFSALSHRNNEVLRVLAIISCLFLPLTLITGIFGMNFDNMPILRESHAYYYTIAGMFVLALCMIGAFRWRRWL